MSQQAQRVIQADKRVETILATNIGSKLTKELGVGMLQSLTEVIETIVEERMQELRARQQATMVPHTPQPVHPDTDRLGPPEIHG